MYIYIHIYTYTYTYIHIYIYTHTHTHRLEDLSIISKEQKAAKGNFPGPCPVIYYPPLSTPDKEQVFFHPYLLLSHPYFFGGERQRVLSFLMQAFRQDTGILS